MLYKVKYGKYWLRRGGIGPEATIYMHPSAARLARDRFEKRIPEQAGKGKIKTIKRGRVVGEIL